MAIIIVLISAKEPAFLAPRFGGGGPVERSK
jgi:hypothetical protein